MKQGLLILQVVVSIVLIIFIILQNKSEGIGRAMGTETASFSTRRGVEKSLYVATYVFIALFLIASIVNFII